MQMVSAREQDYARAPEPLHFPVEEQVPESKRHLEARTLLYQVLKLAFAERAAVGCDQFVYWDPNDPRQCLAPDAFVRFGEPDSLFPSWKVWERGVPQVAVELISASDERDLDWDDKLRRYTLLGVQELVRFDPTSDAPLRVWDSHEQGLVERPLSAPAAQSLVLPGFWLLVADPALGPTLRLSHDAHGTQLYPSPVERAERRLAEREAELARRK